MADKKKTKVRRIKGTRLGELRSGLKALNKAHKAVQKLEFDWVDESEYFKDQVLWPLGQVLDSAIDKTKEDERLVIGHIPKGVMTKRRKLLDVVEKADLALGDKSEEIAKLVDVNPRAIAIDTGFVTTEDEEHIYEDIDPDNMPTPPAEEDTANADDDIPLEE